MTKDEIKLALKQAEKKILTDEERAKLDGSFINLPSGNTHYEVKGEGELVVLTHGYATPYYIYDKIFECLVSNGYKVLRYDLLGRGYSERVNEEYNAELFARQLDDLTSALFGEEKFYLVGTSMGGIITTTFYKNHPEKVKKLILLAPAGMDTFKAPFYMKVAKCPGLGELVFYNIAGPMLLKKTTSELYYVSDEEKDYYQRSFAGPIQYKGFLKATLSSLRHTILRTDLAMIGYEKVAEDKLPMLVIWGTIDKTMPYYQIDRMKEVCPHAQFITYENSGHIFLYDQGDKTNHDILEFLRK